MAARANAQCIAHERCGAVCADQQARAQRGRRAIADDVGFAQIVGFAQRNQPGTRVMAESAQFAQPRLQSDTQRWCRNHATECSATVFFGTQRHRAEIAATTHMDAPDRRRLCRHVAQHAERAQRIQAGRSEREAARVGIGNHGSALRLGLDQRHVQPAAFERARKARADQAATDHQHIMDAIRHPRMVTRRPSRMPAKLALRYALPVATPEARPLHSLKNANDADYSFTSNRPGRTGRHDPARSSFTTDSASAEFLAD